jgi:predicted dehydrogenase
MLKKEKLKLGIVGWGARGGSVARSGYDSLGGMLAPVACVEPSAESYEKTSKRFNLTPNRYLSVAEMLAAEKLDGMMIASPNGLHLQNLKELQGSGLPILLEKPLESNFQLICDVVRFASQYKAPILVGHCMRYAPILKEAKKMITRGDIGEVCSTRFVQHCHYGNGMYHNWRRERKNAGGMFIEKATHDFDIMLWFMETWPDTVAAFGALQAFGGNKPADLRCRNCEERVDCPESIQNIRFRAGQYKVEELESTDDLCVFSTAVDANDNEQTLIRFANGRFGTYVQWFFSPRSYHHRIYEVQGTLGAMEVDLGAEFGGQILFTPRYGTYADQQKYKFDYLQRNHYNGDGEMMKHFYHVLRGEAVPETTVKQAFAAELLGYAADQAVVEKRLITAQDLLPKDLAGLYTEKAY